MKTAEEIKKESENKKKREFNKLLKYAGSGDRKAQCKLGVFYLRGIGTSKDFNSAFLWLKRSAKQGYDIAQYLLGACYTEGKGTKIDLEEAAECFHAAAKQGMKQAQYMFGRCLLEGEGIAKNRNAAILWLKTAADQNNQAAKEELVRLNKSKNEEQHSDNSELQPRGGPASSTQENKILLNSSDPKMHTPSPRRNSMHPYRRVEH